MMMMKLTTPIPTSGSLLLPRKTKTEPYAPIAAAPPPPPEENHPNDAAMRTNSNRSSTTAEDVDEEWKRTRDVAVAFSGMMPGAAAVRRMAPFRQRFRGSSASTNSSSANNNNNNNNHRPHNSQSSSKSAKSPRRLLNIAKTARRIASSGGDTTSTTSSLMSFRNSNKNNNNNNTWGYQSMQSSRSNSTISEQLSETETSSVEGDVSSNSANWEEDSFREITIEDGVPLSRALVVYQATTPSASYTNPELMQLTTTSQSMKHWLQTVDTLIRTAEFQCFIRASHHMLCKAAETAVDTALLPITYPIRVACEATDFVLQTTKDILEEPENQNVIETVIHNLVQLPGFCFEVACIIKEQVESAVVHAITDHDHNHHHHQQHHYNLRNNNNNNNSSSDASTIELPAQPLPSSKLSSSTLTTATSSSSATTPTKPRKTLDSNNNFASSSTHLANDDDFLARLRFDYTPPAFVEPNENPFEPSNNSGPIVSNNNQNKNNISNSTPSGYARSPPRVVQKTVEIVKYTEYLLRVDDLAFFTTVSVKVVDDPATCNPERVHYIDLSDDSDAKLRERGLEKLCQVGLSMIDNHPTVRLGKHYKATPECMVEWKAEGSTGKLLRRMAKLSTLERLNTLQHEVLIWSGKFVNKSPFASSKFPMFLARGICPRSPREFMSLLWDNERTSEYNNYCLGRNNLLVIEDKVLQGASVGSKVIRSETRVPFTSLSVMVTCLMHVRPLEPPDSGFVILSRSLDYGTTFTSSHTGEHPGCVERSRNKNEILWGINIIRRVPGHPHLTDLTSLSQVGSSMVPLFLANKIGMLGVEDFFKNVRTCKVSHVGHHGQQQQN